MTTISLVELVNKFLDEKAKKPGVTDQAVAQWEMILSEFIGYAVKQPDKLEGVYR